MEVLFVSPRSPRAVVRRTQRAEDVSPKKGAPTAPVGPAGAHGADRPPASGIKDPKLGFHLREDRVDTLPWGVCRIDLSRYQLPLPAVCFWRPVACPRGTLQAVVPPGHPESGNRNCNLLHDLVLSGANHPPPISSGSTSTQSVKTTSIMVPNKGSGWQASRLPHARCLTRKIWAARRRLDSGGCCNCLTVRGIAMSGFS